MKSTPSRRGPVRLHRLRNNFLPALLCIPLVGAALAQEGALGPPAPLQFPYEAGPDAPRGVAGAFLRNEIERGADLGLCQALMQEAGRPIPPNFDSNDCEPSFAAKVSNNEGIIHWKSGARPLQCGASCLGRPYLSSTQFVDRPNLRRVTLHGQLRFVIDPPGPINRDLTYSYDINFTCQASNGARQGELMIETRFGDPVIGDPGAVESVLDFVFLPATLSRFIEGKIKSYLQSLPGQSLAYGACASVGAYRDQNPLFDMVMYDPPPAGGRSVRADLAASTALGERATVKFLRLVRNPLPGNVDAAHAQTGNPAAGYFTVFLNGARVDIPAPSPDGLVLPAQGGSFALNHCRSISLQGADRLQIIFANGLGGAAWSQFSKTESFGAGLPRMLTTGRTIILPVQTAPRDPVTGRPQSGKPQAFALREFELLYQIEYQPRPSVATTATTGVRGATGGRRPLGAADIGSVAGVATDPGAPPPAACAPI